MNKFITNPEVAIYKFEKPKLDTPPPRFKPPPSLEFGSYCMRAIVEKTDKSGELEKIYKGYSEDVEITHEVAEACERRRREGERCLPTKLYFIRNIPNCNGIITEHYKDDSLVNVIRYKK